MNELLTPQIYTLKGFTKENIFKKKQMMNTEDFVLDIGCGNRKLLGAKGIDVVSSSDADIVHDLSQFPWPFKDSEFNVILMNQSLEHMDDLLKTISEVHRIGKNGAHIIIQVPYFRCVDAFTDPTHRHFFTSHSLDYFIEGESCADYNYTKERFKKLGFWYGWPHPSKNPLRELLKKFMHKFPDFYDQYLSLLFPVECITWELEVRK